MLSSHYTLTMLSVIHILFYSSKGHLAIISLIKNKNKHPPPLVLSARTYWSLFFILDTSNPCHVVQIYLQIPRGLTTQVNLWEYCPNKAYSCVIWQVLNYISLINQLGYTSISYKSLHTVGSSWKEESSSISAHHSLWLQLSVLSKEVSWPRLTAKLSPLAATQFSFCCFVFFPDTVCLSCGMGTSLCLAW